MVVVLCGQLGLTLPACIPDPPVGGWAQPQCSAILHGPQWASDAGMCSVGSRVGEAYEDLSTVVLDILQIGTGTAPASGEGQSKMQSSCFS
jgi:hypothetical protein